MNKQWILYSKQSVQPEHGQQVQTATENNLKNVKTDPESCQSIEGVNFIG